MEVCVCVPIYNDWGNASLLIENFVVSNFDGVHLLIIDNGSSQESTQAGSYYSGLKNVSLKRIEINQGFGGAVQEASKSFPGDWLIWMPGNMKVIPSDLADFLTLVKSSKPADFIKARRTERPIVDRVKTCVASIVQTLASGRIMVDTGGTPSAVHRDNPLRKIMLTAPKDYRFDSYMLFAAKQAGIKVLRPKVRYRRRLIGRSHWQSGLSAELDLLASLVSSLVSWRKESSLRSEE